MLYTSLNIAAEADFQRPNTKGSKDVSLWMSFFQEIPKLIPRSTYCNKLLPRNKSCIKQCDVLLNFFRNLYKNGKQNFYRLFKKENKLLSDDDSIIKII